MNEVDQSRVVRPARVRRIHPDYRPPEVDEEPRLFASKGELALGFVIAFLLFFGARLFMLVFS